MRYLGLAAVLCALAVIVTAEPLSKKKEKQEVEETQVLPIPRELPQTLIVEPQRLVFRVSPLTAKGLFSRQLRDSLKTILKKGGGEIVQIRAFVAGSGDTRRVKDTISNTFTDKHKPLPVVSVVQVGALPLEGAQVVLESTALSKKKSVNPHGLVFVSGQGAFSDNPLAPVAPLAQKALANLRVALRAARSEPTDVLRVTCFLSSLDNIQAVSQMFSTEYPKAALNYVQPRRAPTRGEVVCEAVARLRWDPGTPLRFLDPNGLPDTSNSSQVALVAAPTVVLSGAQSSFGFRDADVRLAFERLNKDLEKAGSSFKQAAVARYYPLAPSIAEQVRRLRPEFFDKSRPPASTMLPFEGLPSIDSGFAIDVVALTNR